MTSLHLVPRIESAPVQQEAARPTFRSVSFRTLFTAARERVEATAHAESNAQANDD